jgi:hypothetical protein
VGLNALWPNTRGIKHCLLITFLQRLTSSQHLYP